MSRLLLAGLAVRLLLVALGELQDHYSEVKHTDIDYFVYTDASAHVWKGESPYLRHTYRYTPLLAYLLLPCLAWLPFGKLLFIAADMLAAVLLHKILEKHTVSPDKYVACWVFNPLVINITTRGSSDSLTTVLLFTVLYCLDRKHWGWAGFWYGLAVHLRVYPIVYSLSFWLHIDSSVFPTKRRMQFGLVSAGTFIALGLAFYWLYGFEFLQETYLHHISRKDNRHNFSLYFYLLYLTYSSSLSLLAFLPQVTLLIFAAWRLAKVDLPLALFTQTMIFVIFNKVVTAQYFLWYISLLPLLLPRHSLHKGFCVVAVVSFVLTEVFWLSQGYRLEFLSEHVFWEVFTASVGFFASSTGVLVYFLARHSKN
jgi:phosphatidylinositol glycan class M